MSIRKISHHKKSNELNKAADKFENDANDFMDSINANGANDFQIQALRNFQKIESSNLRFINEDSVRNTSDFQKEIENRLQKLEEQSKNQLALKERIEKLENTIHTLGENITHLSNSIVAMSDSNSSKSKRKEKRKNRRSHYDDEKDSQLRSEDTNKFESLNLEPSDEDSSHSYFNHISIELILIIILVILELFHYGRLLFK